jgi:hypothetical protein
LVLVPNRIAATKITTITGTTKNGEVISIAQAPYCFQLTKIWARFSLRFAEEESNAIPWCAVPRKASISAKDSEKVDQNRLKSGLLDYCFVNRCLLEYCLLSIASTDVGYLFHTRPGYRGYGRCPFLFRERAFGQGTSCNHSAPADSNLLQTGWHTSRNLMIE